MCLNYLIIGIARVHEHHVHYMQMSSHVRHGPISLVMKPRHACYPFLPYKIAIITVVVHVRLQDDYEMTGDTMGGVNIHHAPRRARLDDDALLGRYELCCLGQFQLLQPGT